MIAGPVLVSVAAVGLSWLISGALLVSRRAVPAGSLLALSGTLALAACLAGARGHEDGARLLLVLTAMLLTPLAVAAYPRLEWRHPVDFVALVTIAGAGLVALAGWRSDGVIGTMALVIGVTLIGSIWWRIERSLGDDRWALIWMALGVGAPGLAAGVIVFVAPDPAGTTLAIALFVLLGPAMYVGVARPEVIDVRGLVVHSVVFSLAAVVYVAAFVAVASFVEVINGEPAAVGGMAVIGLLVAATFHWTQVRLRGVVDELIFGSRPNPLDAATDVVGHIGDDPVLALRAIREALVLPYASIVVDGEPVATSGTAVTYTRSLPLELGDDSQAELVVGLRPGDLTLSEGDEHVVRLVGPLLAQTLRANQLASDLQTSREATVTALAEERRRLRRDLHDGLGPRLSGIAFTSDAARNSLRSDPKAADALLATLRTETRNAIDEIRRIVYAMRPPALDELGLVPALRQQAVALRTAGGDPLQVTITAGALPETIPAAVEVAAYRIVTEALTNAARHSGSDTASVCLQADDEALSFDVTDAGTTAGGWSAGVGIASMRERAAELGGTLTVDIGSSGSHIRGVLPLPLVDSSE